MATAEEVERAHYEFHQWREVFVAALTGAAGRAQSSDVPDTQNLRAGVVIAQAKEMADMAVRAIAERAAKVPARHPWHPEPTPRPAPGVVG